MTGSDRSRSAEGETASVVMMLKECANEKDLSRGTAIHAQFVTKLLLEQNIFVGSSLINMYVKCGAMSKAQEAFNSLPSLNVVVWNSLITGYVQHGNGDGAIDCFQTMKRQGYSPDAVTYISIFKACGIIGNIEKGQQVHAEVIRDGVLRQDNFVGTALLNMYAKCNLLGKAEVVFQQLAVKNVVAWTALISGYAQQGYSAEALMCFAKMQKAGLCPNAVTLVCALKACGDLRDSERGQKLHAHISQKGLVAKNIVLGTAVVGMYSKCGLLEKAHEVLNELSECNVVTWNAIIMGYAQRGFVTDALNCFQIMQSHGVSPNAITFICLLKACVMLQRVDIGEEIHITMERNIYLDKDIVLVNSLLDMYAKCGELDKAKKVFDGIDLPNAVSWNAIIAGYVHNGEGKGALDHFDSMQLKGMLPNAITYATILKACGYMGAGLRGHYIHAQLVGNNLLETDTFVANALIDMYVKRGILSRAKEVFDRITLCNLVSWTTIIGGYTQHGHNNDALSFFYQMQHENFLPDAAILTCILRACSNEELVDRGYEIHSQIVEDGVLDDDIRVGTALIDMYLRSGFLSEAYDVFNELSVHDIVSWTVLIAGYAQSGYSKEALQSFEQMQLRGFWPDATIYSSTLKACSNMNALGKGQELHTQIVKYGLLEHDVIVGTALISMYAKCGMLIDAEDVFVKLPECNVISWNALVAGYAQIADNEAALYCFQCMEDVGASPDIVTFLCLSRVCGSLGAAYNGLWLHGEIVKRWILDHNTALAGSALVDMYANCCMLEVAKNVLQKLQRDIVSWNALMAGYAHLGDFEHIVDCLKKLIEENLNPDPFTLSIVLNTCNHAGLIEEGQVVFESMFRGFCITPSFDHYIIMVDLFGRAGLLDWAGCLFEVMPFGLTLTMCHSLLGACHKWENLQLGRWAYEHAVQLDGLDAGAHISMSNIYLTVNTGG
ncbi:hypothetical protein KP509_37G002100 [Ceratopteris richardii]|nr:hypothetical protein KP509_37G002100 [Ceratopteris richardii]